LLCKSISSTSDSKTSSKGCADYNCSNGSGGQTSNQGSNSGTNCFFVARTSWVGTLATWGFSIFVSGLVVPLGVTSSDRAIISIITLKLDLNTAKIWIAMGNMTLVNVFAVGGFSTCDVCTSSGSNTRIGSTDIVIITDENGGIDAASRLDTISLEAFGVEVTVGGIVDKSAMFGNSFSAISIADSLVAIIIAVNTISGRVTDGGTASSRGTRQAGSIRRN